MGELESDRLERNCRLLFEAAYVSSSITREELGLGRRDNVEDPGSRVTGDREDCPAGRIHGAGASKLHIRQEPFRSTAIAGELHIASAVCRDKTFICSIRSRALLRTRACR